MDEDLKLLIGLGIDSDSETKLRAKLKGIKEDYNKINFEVNLDEKTIKRKFKDVEKAKKVLEALKFNVDTKGLDGVKNVAKDVSSGVATGFKGAGKNVENVIKDVKELRTSIKELYKDGKATGALIKTTDTKNGSEKVIEKKNQKGQTIEKTTIDTSGADEIKRQQQEAKILNKIKETGVKLSEKANDIERKGLADGRSITKFKNQIISLSSKENKELKDQERILSDIQKQYKLIQNQEKKNKFKADKQKEIDKLNNNINKNIDPTLVTKGGMNKASKAIQGIKDADTEVKMEKAVAKAVKAYDELIAKQKISISNIKDEARLKEQQEKTQQNLTKTTDKYARQLEEIEHNMKRSLTDNQRIGNVNESILKTTNEINQAKQRGEQLTGKQEKNLEDQITAIRRLVQSHGDIEGSLRRQATLTRQLDDKFQSTAYRATRGLDRNPREERALTREHINPIRQQIDGLNGLNGEAYNREVAKIEKALRRLNEASRRTREQLREDNNSILNRFQRAIQTVPIYLSAMTLFYGSMRAIGQGFQSLLDVDKAMINLSKVTEATTEDLDKFKMTALEIGSELGVVASEVITATGEFQKLGYSLQQASQLGQNTILYANVGDMSIDSASQNIVSTIKGFGIEVDMAGNNVTGIVDIFNEVGNNFAITSEGIGEALKRSSAVLHEAGNSVEQSVALVTSANSSIQDPARVGTALKTIAMRLRGVSEDGEDVSKLVPDLQKTFANLGKSINLMDEADPTKFQSTYDIMQQISGIWGELSDMEQADLVEKIGGKHQGVVVSAMINNWSDAVGSYETALDSAGSAQREFSAYMEGFEYKIGQLKSAIEAFWVTLVNDDFVKSVVVTLTEVVKGITKLVDTVGSLQIAIHLLGAGLILGIKSLRQMVFGTTAYNVGLVTALAVTNGFKAGVVALGRALVTLLTRLGVIGLAITAVSMAVSGFMAWKDKEKNARADHIQTLNDEITAYENLKEAYTNNGVDRYLDLSDKKEGAGLNTEEFREYQQLQNSISASMPELVSHYDEHSNAILKSAEAIEELYKEEEKLNSSRQREALNLEIEDADWSSMQDAVDSAKQALNNQDWSMESEKGYSIAKQILDEEISQLEQGTPEYLDAIVSMYEKVDKAISSNNPNKQMILDNIGFVQRDINMGNLDEASNKLDKEVARMKKSVAKLNKTYAEVKNDITNVSADFESKLDSLFRFEMTDRDISVNSNDFKFMTEIKNQFMEDIDSFNDKDIEDSLKRVPKIVEEAFATMKKAEIDVDRLIAPSSDTSKIEADFMAVINNIDMNSDHAQTLKTGLEELMLKQLEVAQSMKNNPLDAFGALDEAISVSDQLNQELSGLDSAYRTLSDGQQLSVSQTLDLIKNYPELTKHMETQNGVIKLTAKAIKDLASTKETTAKNEIQIAKTLAITAQEKAKASIRAIMSEAKAEQLLADVKSKGIQYALRGAKTIQEAMELEKRAGAVMKADEEIRAIEALLNIDYSANLGNLNSIKTSSPAKDKKEKEKKELQDAIYLADKYQQGQEALNASIEKQQRLQANYSTHHAQYAKSLKEEARLTRAKKSAIDGEIKSIQAQIKAKNIKKTGIVTVGGKEDDNKTARAKQADIQAEIDKAKSELINLQAESETTMQRIRELSFTIIEANVSVFNQKREALQDDIAYTEYAMSLYAEGSKNYTSFANNQLTYLKQIQRYHQQELLYLEKEKKTNKNLTSAQITQLEELIRAEREAVYTANKAVQDLQQSIAEITISQTFEKITREMDMYSEKIDRIRDKMKYEIDEEDYHSQIQYQKEILSLSKGQVADAKNNLKTLNAMKLANKGNHELVKMIDDELKSWNDNLISAENGVKDMELELKKAYKDLAEQFVEMYKERMELMKRAEEERYDEMMDAEQKAHDKKMKNLDDELDKLRKIYNERMEMIDREEATHDFDTGLENLQGEAKALQSKISVLKMSNSYADKEKRLGLEKELAEKLKEIEETKRDRQVDLRKQDLQDDLENEEEKLENKKTLYDEQFEEWKKMKEDEKKARDKYWEEEMNNERKFAQIRQQILDGNFSSMLSTVQGWSSDVTKEMGYLGENITKNFTDKVTEAINALSALGKVKVGSLNSSIGVGGTNVDSDYKPPTNDRDSGSVNSGGDTLATPSSGSSGAKKKVMVTANVWLFEQASTSSKKIKILKKGEVYWKYSTQGSMSNLGGGWTNSSSLKEVTDATGGTNTASTGSSASSGSSSSGSSATPTTQRYHTVAKGETMGSLSQKYYKDATKWKKIADANPKVNPNSMQIGTKLLVPFRSGGFTGDWSGDGGKVAILHKKELVLNQEQTSDILSTAKVVENIKNVLPSLGRSISRGNSNTTSDSTSSVSNEYNINVQVDSMNGDRDSADIVADQILNRMKRTKGGRF